MVPESVTGSTDRASLCIARIDAYSVPCAPQIRESTGPGRAPWIKMTGRFVAASAPVGTVRKPSARWPGRAVAVPKVTSAAYEAVQIASAPQYTDLGAMIIPLEYHTRDVAKPLELRSEMGDGR